MGNICFDGKYINSVKKSQQCLCCGRFIERNTRAYKWAGVIDGQFYSCYNHATCQEWTKTPHGADAQDYFNNELPYGYAVQFDEENENLKFALFLRANRHLNNPLIKFPTAGQAEDKSDAV